MSNFKKDLESSAEFKLANKHPELSECSIKI